MSHVHDHENHVGRGPRPGITGSLRHDLESGGSPWTGASTEPEPAVTLGEPPEGVTRSSDGIPPDVLSLEDARRWAAGWALHVGSRLTTQPGVSFHGTPGDRRTPGSDRVTVELNGAVLGRLCNVRDPGQPFGWGYTGAGPSALAKSLLVAALGQAAACPGCRGTGKVTWLATGSAHPVPWEPAHDDLAALATAEEAEAVITACDGCDGEGLAVHPRLYHRLVTDLVAGRWQQGHGWRVSRDELLDWVNTTLGAAWAQVIS
jgi:Family of unknown function (DUF6166)